VKAEKHDHKHGHTEDIETVAIATPGDLDGVKVSQWFRELIGEFGEKIMRMKGILNLRKDTDQFVFQGVHLLFEGRPGRAWQWMKNGSIARFLSAPLRQRENHSGFMNCITTTMARPRPTMSTSSGGSKTFRLTLTKYATVQTILTFSDAP
jgi:G3E family GTPase